MLHTLMFEAGELDFGQWLEAVEREFERVTSLGREDFPDWHYADAYYDCVEPVEAARLALASHPTGQAFLQHAGIDPEGVF